MGPKIYNAEIARSNCTTKTGLGIFCEFTEGDSTTKILIQASTLLAPSPLYAEASALLLATKIDAALNLSRPTFLTDNLTLAKAATTNSLSDLQVP
jgi:hypothetical protein